MSKQRRSVETIREDLLDQMEWMADEMSAIALLTNSFPQEVFELQPGAGELSIKQIYGAIALMDEQVYSTGLREIVENGATDVEPVDVRALGLTTDWAGEDLADVLDRARKARLSLHRYLSGVDAASWAERSDLIRVVGGLVQMNTDLLREAGQRLYGVAPDRM